MASEVTSVVIGYRSWNTVERGVSIFYFYIIWEPDERAKRPAWFYNITDKVSPCEKSATNAVVFEVAQESANGVWNADALIRLRGFYACSVIEAL
jgi:hypothetical protein